MSLSLTHIQQHLTFLLVYYKHVKFHILKTELLITPHLVKTCAKFPPSSNFSHLLKFQIEESDFSVSPSLYYYHLSLNHHYFWSGLWKKPPAWAPSLHFSSPLQQIHHTIAKFVIVILIWSKIINMSLSSLIQNKIYNFLLDYITSSDLALAYFTHYLLPDSLICYVPSGLPTVF